ncbi:JAB domain-containing protein [Hufsiella ginkgonis]|uniref:DNA repair protein RadC n=1 Tax=Hufsiella ginkgonis TaxID=2695274 RepID=A0A7K1XTW0_9SPHI|nr:JAB domain-containing protein [Hufsiella ginkgonis]MXV14414.1 DNA repair protein RadC [Hufsiella ginkgonis]
MRYTKKHPLKEAELHLSFKPPTNPIKISSCTDAERAFRSIWDTPLLPIQEQFYVIYLNRASHVLCWRCLHTGTCTGATIDIKLLLATAYGCLAQSVLIAHNHPSGSLKPSKADLKLTNTIDLACHYNELMLLDHIILNQNSFMSFVDARLLSGYDK